MGRRLRALRAERGLTQTQVAGDRRVRIATGTLQSIESGARETRDSKIEKVARFFGTSLTLLRATGDQITANDPRLVDMTDEALRIARRFLVAPTAVRQRVERLLTQGEHDLASRLAERLAKLPQELLGGFEDLIRAAEEQQVMLAKDRLKQRRS